MSKIKISIKNSDGDVSKEGFFDFPFLPRVGEEIKLMPLDSPIRTLSVLKIGHTVSHLDLDFGFVVTSLICEEL